MQFFGKRLAVCFVCMQQIKLHILTSPYNLETMNKFNFVNENISKIKNVRLPELSFQ